MESPFKPYNLDGVTSNMKSEADFNFRRQRLNYDIILRVLGLFITLIAAIVIGTNKKTEILDLTLTKTLPPVHIPVNAKWHYMSAFVYLLVSNAISCAYSAGSLVFYMVKKNIRSTLLVTVLDIIMTALLFSANGAVASVGLIGRYGNSHVQWNKVCNLVDGFCRQMAIAFTFSLVGSFVFLWLAVHAIIHLHRKSTDVEGVISGQVRHDVSLRPISTPRHLLFTNSSI